LKQLWPLVGDPSQLSAVSLDKQEVGEVLDQLRKEFMREFVVELTGVSSFKRFITAFNKGFCRHVHGRWNGNWNAFDDYLSWPEEKQYRLVFRGWRRCRGIGTYNRKMVRQICREYPNIEVVYT
jgi:hypothetical protein